MDKPNAALIVKGEYVGGDVADVHIRKANGCVQFCAVYVWPKGRDGRATKDERPENTMVNGYWFTPTYEEADALARRFAA